MLRVHSGWMPASAARRCHLATSAAMNAFRRSGDIGIGTMPTVARRSFTSGRASAFVVAACSRSTTGAGMRAGPTTANQAVMS